MKTKSIWGNPPKRLYKLMKIAEKSFGIRYTACIVGCSDGKWRSMIARMLSSEVIALMTGLTKG